MTRGGAVDLTALLSSASQMPIKRAALSVAASCAQDRNLVPGSDLQPQRKFFRPRHTLCT